MRNGLTCGIPFREGLLRDRHTGRGLMRGEKGALAKIFSLNPVVSSHTAASSRVPQPGRCASFDGVDGYIRSKELIREDLDVTIVFKINASDTGSKAIFGGGGSSQRFYAQHTNYNGGSLHVVIGSYQSANTGVNQLTGVSTGVWHTLRMKSNGDWWFNGAFVANVGSSITGTTADVTDNKLHIGRRGDSTGTHRNINVCHFSVLDDGVLSTQFNLDHKGGTTVYNSSGTGSAKDATLVNGASFVVDDTKPPEWDKLNNDGFTKAVKTTASNGHIRWNSFSHTISRISFGFYAKSEITTSSTGKVLFDFDSTNGVSEIWIGNATGLFANEVMTVRTISNSTVHASTDNISEGWHEVDIINDGAGSGYIIYIDGVAQTMVYSNSNSSMLTTTDLDLGAGSADNNHYTTVYRDLKIWDDGDALVLDASLEDLDGGLVNQVDGEAADDVIGSPVALLLPRDESDLTKDVLGNELQYSGSVYPVRPKKRNSYCANPDGIDDHLSVPHLIGTETVVSSGGTSTPSISAGRIDFTAGTCWDLVLSDGTRYPLSEGKGADVHNVILNSDHATWQNASTSTEGAGVWAGRTDDFHWNAEKGFTLSSGVRIPALADGSLNAADGSGAVTNPPADSGGGHNDAECSFDYCYIAEDDQACPASYELGDLEEVSFDVFVQNFDDLAFARLKSSTAIDRIVAYSDALTGEDLALAERYTNTV